MFAQLKKFILASGVSGNEKGISSVIAAAVVDMFTLVVYKL